MHHMILLMPLLALVLFILLPWQLALPLYLPVLMGSLLVHWKIIQAQRQPPITGKRAMIGGRAMVVKSEFGEVVVQVPGLGVERGICPALAARSTGDHQECGGADFAGDAVRSRRGRRPIAKLKEGERNKSAAIREA